MKGFRAVLCLLLVCLLLTGCRSAEEPLRQEALSAVQPAAVSEDEREPQSVDRTYETSGKLRLPYTGNRSSVRYVTSAEQLPQEEAFAQYDEAYFEDHALLLVIETVSSGSVQVGIESVDPADSTVTLSHHMPGDVGTADMATWLLWIETEPGLTDSWTVTNPALKPDNKTSTS